MLFRSQFIQKVNPVASGANPIELTNFNGKLYFSSFNGSSKQRWSLDPTIASNKPQLLAVGKDFSTPRPNQTDVNGAIYYTDSTNRTYGNELFVETNPTVSIGDISIVEGNNGKTNAVFTVTLTISSSQDYLCSSTPTALIEIADNDAVKPSLHYQANSNSIDIAGGSDISTLKFTKLAHQAAIYWVVARSISMRSSLAMPPTKTRLASTPWMISMDELAILNLATMVRRSPHFNIA